MKVKSFKSNEIGVEFKVWASTFDRVSHRLYLLGSHKEIGAWAIESAVEAFPTPDLHIWSVQVGMPPMSRFEWVWLKINTKTKKVSWERPVKRNRTLGCFSGVLHSVWGEHEEVFLQTAAHVEVTTFKRVEEGFVLAITGGTTTLGNWDTSKAVIASEFPNRSGYWKASFAFDAYTNVEFKWAVLKEKALDTVLIQEKLPHCLFGRNTWMKVAAPWMTTSTVVVDTLPLGDKLDNKMGRTDIIVRNRMTRLMEIRHWMERARSSIEFPRTLASPRPETSGRLTGSTQDRAVIDALKKMWTQIPEDEDKVERRSSIQLSKNFRNISQVFAIKGAGQTLMPTDFVNAGCLCWSRIVSEGERRVLDRPLRGPMSLWNLSMMMARRSLQLSGKQNQATSRKPNEAQACAELQASGDTSEAPQAVDGCRVPPGLLPYSYDPVEKSRLAEMYEERGVGEGKCKCEVEERNQRDAAGSNKEKDLLRPERRRCTSLVLCEIDNASDAESEKSPQERQSDNKDTYTFERIPEEHAEMEIGADATEFFKSLEISHSEEVLAAEKHKLKACTSDVFIRDSGLSSFGLDVYVSNECTSNEPDSLMDDASSEHQRQVHSSTDLGSMDGSLRSYVDDGDAVTSLRSNKELEDEGFTELDRACKSACMWDEMPIGPLPEDESDIGEGNGRRAYWKVLQHSRQMALPLLTARQEKLQPTQPDPQIMTQMPKSSTPDLYEQKRDTEECNDIPHYIKSLSSPPAPTTEETLGHLYEQHEDSNCWQYWLKGDRLSEGFDAGESSSLDEGSNDDMSTTDLNAYSSEACMVNPQTTRFNIDALEAVPCDSTPSKLTSSHAFVESSIENLSINRTAIGKGEGGDASNCEEKSCDCFQEDLNAPSPPGNIADLLDVPFEDLNIMERRVMAQALESEWGRMSSAENCGEGGPKSRRAITEDKLVVRDALLCPRRFYRAARHSVSDLYHLVDRGSTAVDRRAMARQAERMWGRAASSRCR